MSIVVMGKKLRAIVVEHQNHSANHSEDFSWFGHSASDEPVDNPALRAAGDYGCDLAHSAQI